MKKRLLITSLMTGISIATNALADDFTYYTEGPYAGLPKTQDWGDDEDTYHVEYIYEGNTRTSIKTINGGNQSSSIVTYKESIAYYVSQATPSQFETNNVFPNNDEMYSVGVWRNADFTIGGKSKFMQNSDENGNSLSFVNASFDADGNIKNYSATIYEPYTNIELKYENGKIVEQKSGRKGFNINYDEETGKPVSKERSNSIVETYDFTSDGKLKICDAQGQNCETTQYSSLEDYLLAPFAALNLTDVFDSDFGQKGYIPSRLQEKHADGSVTIYNEDGTLKGYKGKRIYTIDEANRVAGTRNRISIKYR